MIRNLFLAGGILSSILYVLMNVVIPRQWPAYSIFSQTVSELSAIDAPTRPVWVAFGFIYTILFIGFGFGVRMSSGENSLLRISADLIIVYGLVSVAWPFSPMHLRGEGFNASDVMHIILAMVTLLLMILTMTFGAAALGRSFRIYTAISMAIFLVFGALTGMDSPRIKENLPTPMVGIWERINIGIFLIWVIVFAIIIMTMSMRTAHEKF